MFTFNDFSHKGKEVVLKEQKEITGLDRHVPYLITEYGGHMYPTKRFDQEARLVEHALRHARVQNATELDGRIAGAIGWCAFDYNTHYDFGSGDRICYHGVMDMFRIPKVAACFYKSQLAATALIVLELVTLWTRGENDEGHVTPIVVFTNCEFIDFYIAGALMGRYYPDFIGFGGLSNPPIMIADLPVGQWGFAFETAQFVGYYDGKEAARKTYAKNPVAKLLEAAVDDCQLKADGFDATRVVYRITDQAGNVVPFINEIIEFELSGQGDIIGPAQTALIGGCMAVWVRSKGVAGEIVLSARCTRLAAENVRIMVR